MSKKMSLSESFKNIFGEEDKYFGEWFIEFDEPLEKFLNNLKLESEINFQKQIQYLYLYLESLEILKKPPKNQKFPLSNVISIEVWYCSVLLLFIGLIDQHTKKRELKANGTPKKMKQRFQAVMNSLTDERKNDMLMHYGGKNKYKKFCDITFHLYDTRNFFAHEVIIPRNTIPQDGFFSFDYEQNQVWYINMPYGRIFLTVVIALIRYHGYPEEIQIKSNKKFNNFADMLRTV